ncbi:MAG: DEAD/DEAH box helicase, partial [Bacteroidales bacterium]|nr:DEAD/DEAH box helicase [Bacteroidales bacterium]
MSNTFFKDTLSKFLHEETSSPVFHEPYINIQLPFNVSNEEINYFTSFELKFKPYVHQSKAFERLAGNDGQSTIIATGTGSGKTECFLYPILDYCYNNMNTDGIKAILIYPMNALATDQAKRIAKFIYESPKLKDNIEVGLYIGSSSKNRPKDMDHDHVISDRIVLRNRPPSILITNYKMLDYLLLRPIDTVLWANNNYDTLKYLVVDELHTFDGAQATDLACLIRRLKARLLTRPGYLCCVGTSATLGVKDSVSDLREYAKKIFGEPFEDNFLITEDRLSADQFLQNVEPSNYTIPELQKIEDLKIISLNELQENYLAYFASIWLGENIDAETIKNPSFRLALGDKLKQHIIFQHLIHIFEEGFFQIKEILNELNIRYPGLFEDDYYKKAIYGFIDLISHARTGSVDSLRPFLTVSVHLWIRELRRLVAKVGDINEITYSITNDLNEKQVPFYLPVVNCRECGETGWVSVKKENNNVSITNYDNFYKKYFNHDNNIWMMFPYVAKQNIKNKTHNDSIDKETTADDNQTTMLPMFLCPHCMTLKILNRDDDPDEPCEVCGKKGKLTVLTKNFSNSQSNTKKQFVCPFCGSTNSFTLMGWRATTAISTCLNHLFSTKYNDDKKILAFSDNVQDAAHLSGFFNFRTIRFVMRSAIQRYVLSNSIQSLETFQTEFVNYWRNKWTIEQFISNFTPPEFINREKYEEMKENEEYVENVPKDEFVEGISRRLRYEILLEYGLLSNNARSLEKTDSSILSFSPSSINKAVENVGEAIRNELGMLREIKDNTIFKKMIIGILNNMRLSGAFNDSEYYTFIRQKGKAYLLSQKHTRWLPRSHRAVNIPRFPYVPNKKYNTNDFDHLKSAKYAGWIRSCMPDTLTNLEQCSKIVKIILEELTKVGLVTVFDSDTKVQLDTTVWGLNKDQIYVSTAIEKMICNKCGSTISVSKDNAEFWVEAPCVINSCSGKYTTMNAPPQSYFSKLYSEGDLVRLVAHEHTGILSRELRDNLEISFKNSDNDRNPWDYNLLTCTPTMEMGIDIGDLSTVILCNVPPAEQQFIQRSGRAGRKDGNSFIVTVARAVPHDLYFFEEPREMINAKIKVPTIFLEAPAVLERQFFAYSMDYWVTHGSNNHKISAPAIHPNIGKSIANLDKHDVKLFPYNFLDFVKHNIVKLTNQFSQMFSGDLNSETIATLKEFAQGDKNSESPMNIKVLKAFQSCKNQIDSISNNIKEIKKLINNLRKQPKDTVTEKEIKQYEASITSLTTVQKKLKRKNLYNFLSDEGILPNYAFPEAGMTLKAVIKRKKIKENRNIKVISIFEYVRASSSAIREFAPSNDFYVDGRRLTIDQVDLSTTEIEQWRLCPECSHAEIDNPARNYEKCPNCHSTAWADIGQVKTMMKLRLVYSNIDDDDDHLILDNHDDRMSRYYLNQMLVDINESQDNLKAYSMINNDFPFGYDFAKQVTLREINFGISHFIGEKVAIAGKEMVRQGFKICEKCGKIYDSNNKENHSDFCPVKSGMYNDNSPYIDCLFLYRDFQTEALRLLVPATTTESSNVRLESFNAAIMLGLREHFGNV